MKVDDLIAKVVSASKPPSRFSPSMVEDLRKILDHNASGKKRITARQARQHLLDEYGFAIGDHLFLNAVLSTFGHRWSGK